MGYGRLRHLGYQLSCASATRQMLFNGIGEGHQSIPHSVFFTYTSMQGKQQFSYFGSYVHAQNCPTDSQPTHSASRQQCVLVQLSCNPFDCGATKPLSRIYLVYVNRCLWSLYMYIYTHGHTYKHASLYLHIYIHIYTHSMLVTCSFKHSHTLSKHRLTNGQGESDIQAHEYTCILPDLIRYLLWM